MVIDSSATNVTSEKTWMKLFVAAVGADPVDASDKEAILGYDHYE